MTIIQAREAAAKAAEADGFPYAINRILEGHWDDTLFVQSALLAIQASSAETDRLREWQPIETAPKDGTSILAVVCGAHSVTGKPFIPEVVEWDHGDWFNEMWEEGQFLEPTHWMPLPAAPALASLPASGVSK